MREALINKHQKMMIAAPVLLIFTMYFAFKFLVERFGSPIGFYGAMLIYWLVWCLCLPIYVLGGPRGVLDLFKEVTLRFGKPAWRSLVLLWSPLVFPALFRFLPRFHEANIYIFIVSILIGIVIGVTEEILWRGVYIKLFPDSLFLSYIYPSIGFALWHLAPQSVLPNPSLGGVASFVIYALFLGLAYGYYVRKTGSIRWCTISHCIHDSLGLPGFAFVPWL